MRTDLDTLKQRILEATRKSPVSGQVEKVALEVDRDEEGTDFLRVIVQVRNIDSALESDFEELLEEIERTVGAVDERYPSVRFSDAA